MAAQSPCAPPQTHVGPARELGAWTAAAGRTFCVLKGRQNMLFGRGGMERFIRTDIAIRSTTGFVCCTRGHHPMQYHRLFWVATEKTNGLIQDRTGDLQIFSLTLSQLSY